MSKPRYVLRDLPGIAEFEARLARIAAHPNPDWAPDQDGLYDHVDQILFDLFGIKPEPKEPTAEEVLASWNDPKPPAEDVEPEPLPEIPDGPISQEEVDDALEFWDLSDGHGEPLECLTHLFLPIVAATLGREGHLPDAPVSDGEAKLKADAWGAGLEVELAKFKREKRK